MEKLVACPACNHRAFSALMQCKDFTVSRDAFTIVTCQNCALEFTNPRPAQEEIGAFYASADYVSHSDDQAPGLINEIYRRVRKITLAQKSQLIHSFLPKKGALLDIGCGTGSFAGYMQAKGWKVTGVEPDPGAAAKASEKIRVYEERWLEGCDQQFDLITMWHVLEHVHALQSRFKQLYDLCRPGGFVLIAVPNPYSIDSKHYGELWAARDVPRHLYHFPPHMLRQRMEAEGFKVVKTAGMPFDPFYISMLSERYRHGNDRLMMAFIKGLWFWLRSVIGKDLWSSQIYIFRKPV